MAFLTKIPILHYLVKCTIHYYTTVNNMFHAIPNDQQTLLLFIDILSTKLVNMLLMMSQVVYSTRLVSGLFGSSDMNFGVTCPETRQCRGLCVCDWTGVLLKDKELPMQITSGTYICELVCSLKEDIQCQ